MKILALNLNTSPAITDIIARAAASSAHASTRIDCLTARFGARYISSRQAAAIAEHAALDLFAHHVGRRNPNGYGAILIACFGEPGVLALREASPIPVIGLAEASMQMAMGLGERITIVTAGKAWIPMLTEHPVLQPFSDRLAGILATPETGASVAGDPDAFTEVLLRLCNEAIKRLRSDAIILGGAGLTGFAGRLAPYCQVPLLDSVECGVQRAEALAKSGERNSTPAATPVDTIGLSDELRDLFAAPREFDANTSLR